MKKRKAPDGREYIQCEALIKDAHDLESTRHCRRAASKGDRLCPYHANQRDRVNSGNYIITISRKNSYRGRNRFGEHTYRLTVIGKLFNSVEDAELWCRLNTSLIWKIPNIKSYCIEPFHRVKRSIEYQQSRK